MDDVKVLPFQCVDVPIRLDDNGGGFDAADDIQLSQPSSGPCEFTISFQGEVYVFPAATPQKVQAVLLLLGGPEALNSSPSFEFPLKRTKKVSPICFGGANNVSNRATGSHRIASLERFREKRKERCFENKIRMHRKNGQFASAKGICKPSDSNSGSGGSTPSPKPLFNSSMRRGPCGPRTLCNACGLMWANKGALRDLAKGGKHHIFDQSEQRTPELEHPALMPPRIPSGLDITNGVVDDSSVGIETSSGKLSEQDTLEELAKAARSEFGIPTNFAEQRVDWGMKNAVTED